jgi:hypothetical protein
MGFRPVPQNETLFYVERVGEMERGGEGEREGERGREVILKEI